MRRLRPWQEVRGRYRGLRHEGGQQVITLDCVGDIAVENLEVDAEPGDVVAVLRTDNGYLMRKG